MKILKSQRKLEINGFFIGFIVSGLFHICLIYTILLYKPDIKKVNPINITKIDLEFFEIGGGLNDAPPVKNVEPIEQVEDVEIAKEVVEPKEEIVEVVKEVEEIIKEKEIVEVVKEDLNIIKKEKIDKVIKKEKPKPVKKQKKVQQQNKKVENKQLNEQKETANSGYNAYNLNSNKIASSAITRENTTQSLSANEKADIGAQIQAIIAKEAQKNYPRAARRMRKQGVSVIEFTYHKNGDVANLKVTKSSGHKILDDTVLSVINKVKHKFPKIKADTTFEVPIKFTLR
ncbi:MAG: energy transducer TonB [Campylobacter sputorum]|uniref:energy transducer TonB n=1 Tax=Campylobacter sputorum TaxID=206 RepID=UPI000B781F9E|nr:energy transducer TonB [Campylobacter sputorum]ASM38779.1 energy transduction protein TonB [Campylobacter sputorum bv. paraureolyticus LMG 11764]MDY6120569.1 energy transducer TonB [Campylobacter sputorum]